MILPLLLVVAQFRLFPYRAIVVETVARIVEFKIGAKVRKSSIVEHVSLDLIIVGFWRVGNRRGGGGEGGLGHDYGWVRREGRRAGIDLVGLIGKGRQP